LLQLLDDCLGDVIEGNRRNALSGGHGLIMR
jgi:hypothetical protein